MYIRLHFTETPVWTLAPPKHRYLKWPLWIVNMYLLNDSFLTEVSVIMNQSLAKFPPAPVTNLAFGMHISTAGD